MNSKQFEDIEIGVGGNIRLYASDTEYETHSSEEILNLINNLFAVIKKVTTLGEKQANFIQSKGFTFDEFVNFIADNDMNIFEGKRFENQDRIIIDNKTGLHYIMTLDWEVGLITKLLNELHDGKEHLNKKLSEIELKERYYKLRTMLPDDEYKRVIPYINQRKGIDIIDHYESEMIGGIVIYNDIGDSCFGSVSALCDLINKLHNENESRKEYQRVLESKIRRLKDRVKVFEKNYSMKDIERIRNGELKGCL